VQNVCPQFEKMKSGLRDVLKNKEAGFSREQTDYTWKKVAEQFAKGEAILKMAGDAGLYMECDKGSNYVAGLIQLVPGMGGAVQNGPIRKKDF
jgi:hypothetical protein